LRAYKTQLAVFSFQLSVKNSVVAAYGQLKTDNAIAHKRTCKRALLCDQTG